IAQAHRRRRRRCNEQPGDFLGRKEMRQLALRPRIAQRLGGIAVRQPFALGKLVEAAKRCQAASNGRLGVTRFMQSRDIAAKIKRRDPSWLRCLAASRSEERRVGKECRTRWWPED